MKPFRTAALLCLASVIWTGAAVVADRATHNPGFSLLIGAAVAGAAVFGISLCWN